MRTWSGNFAAQPHPWTSASGVVRPYLHDPLVVVVVVGVGVDGGGGGEDASSFHVIERILRYNIIP